MKKIKHIKKQNYKKKKKPDNIQKTTLQLSKDFPKISSEFLVKSIAKKHFY